MLTVAAVQSPGGPSWNVPPSSLSPTGCTRAPALFAAEAGKQAVPVTIRKGDGEAVDASSILGVMTLGAGHGDEVVLSTDTDDERALAALESLVAYLEQDSA